MQRLLLHACCGPCSLEPTRILAEDGVDFAVSYINPNMNSQEEFDHRLDTLRQHVTTPREIKLSWSDYAPEAWEEKVAVHGLNRAKRCRACYRLRFEELARQAVDQGFDCIGTTLTISPYQFTEVIFEELGRAAVQHGLQAHCVDYRSCYQEATRVSKEKGMYRQNYCGCRFSVAEAEAERRERKAIAARKKAWKQAALMTAAAEGVVNQPNQL